MNVDTINDLQHFIVYQQFNNGGWVTLSYVVLKKKVWIYILNITGLVDPKTIRFEHKGKLYMIPPFRIEQGWDYKDRFSYSSSIHINAEAIQCDNLEYLEWKYEQRCRS